MLEEKLRKGHFKAYEITVVLEQGLLARGTGEAILQVGASSMFVCVNGRSCDCVTEPTPPTPHTHLTHRTHRHWARPSPPTNASPSPGPPPTPTGPTPRAWSSGRGARTTSRNSRGRPQAGTGRCGWRSWTLRLWCGRARRSAGRWWRTCWRWGEGGLGLVGATGSMRRWTGVRRVWVLGIGCWCVHAHVSFFVSTRLTKTMHAHPHAEVEAIRRSAGMRAGLRLTLVLEGVHGVRFYAVCRACRPGFGQCPTVCMQRRAPSNASRPYSMHASFTDRRRSGPPRGAGGWRGWGPAVADGGDGGRGGRAGVAPPAQGSGAQGG